MKTQHARQVLFLMLLVCFAGTIFAQAQEDQYRRGGGACFYKDADYKGEKFCVQKGDRVGQLPRGFNDTISSVRLYGRVSVVVYQSSNFGGPSLRLQDDCANLRSYQVRPGHSWNDQISSIEVH